MPTVSIIVPNYNHARFLPKRMDSILRQTSQDFELILLDDCSTDESRSVLSEFATLPRARFEWNQTNSGSTFKQWNKGVRLARGKYVWIAESDDYADERLLERLLRILEADAGIAFAYCRAFSVNCHGSDAGAPDGFVDRFYSDLGAHWSADFVRDGREECRSYLVQRNTVTNTSGVVFRRQIYEQLGGADETLNLCGDWKLWAAMALTGKVGFIAEPLNYIRFHPGTVRNKSARDGLDTAETLHVTRWIVERTAPRPEVLHKVVRRQASLWVPAVMSLHIPVSRKKAILRDVLAIDPHPLRSALGPALSTVRRKFARHWRDVRPLPQTVQ